MILSYPRNFAPPVSILKPVRGLDRETYENYASFCRQDYPEFEILFCVTDEQDPAIPVIEQIIRDYPQRSIRLLIGSEPLRCERQSQQALPDGSRGPTRDLLLVSDSDVRVESGFLRAVAAPFYDSRVGGVTCLYRGITDGSFAADIEAIGNSADFAAGVLVAWLLGDLDFMLGAVMATSKHHLGNIGGFESLVDYFCDDYELGHKIAAGRDRVELSRFPVSIVYPRQTLAQAFRHQLRWNLSIRYSRPWGHLGLIFSQGLPWALLGAALAHSAADALGYIVAYLVLRIAMAAVVAGSAAMGDILVLKQIWLLPIRDAFAFAVWLASFFPQRIQWRDREFYVRNKRLVPAPPRRAP